MDPQQAAELSAYSPQQRRLEVAAIVAFGLLGAWSLFRA